MLTMSPKTNDAVLRSVSVNANMNRLLAATWPDVRRATMPRYHSRQDQIPGSLSVDDIGDLRLSRTVLGLRLLRLDACLHSMLLALPT